MLFLSDDDLKAEQRKAWRTVQDMPPDQRRDALENLREQRAHARFRELAWWLLVAPALFAVLSVVAQWVAATVLAPGPTPTDFVR